MFTGIVTEVGTLAAVRRYDGGVDLVVEAPATAARLALGASVALNGVCQTVVEMPDGVGARARRFRAAGWRGPSGTRTALRKCRRLRACPSSARSQA